MKAAASGEAAILQQHAQLKHTALHCLDGNILKRQRPVGENMMRVLQKPMKHLVRQERHVHWMAAQQQ
jgi:hypothetical protein